MNVGTYYVKATVAADANHTAKTSAAVKLVIKKAASTITLKAKTANYTGKAIKIAAATKTGSTGKVTYTYYTNSGCTVKTTKANSGAAATGGAPVNAGTYYVKATVAADANHTAKTSAAVKLVIKKVSNKITASNFTKKKAASAQTFSIGAKRLGGAKLTYKSNNSNITVSAAGKVTIKKNYTGKATITITAAATANYNMTTKNITVTVK